MFDSPLWRSERCSVGFLCTGIAASSSPLWSAQGFPASASQRSAGRHCHTGARCPSTRSGVMTLPETERHSPGGTSSLNLHRRDFQTVPGTFQTRCIKEPKLFNYLMPTRALALPLKDPPDPSRGSWRRRSSRPRAAPTAGTDRTKKT